MADGLDAHGGGLTIDSAPGQGMISPVPPDAGGPTTWKGTGPVRPLGASATSAIALPSGGGVEVMVVLAEPSNTSASPGTTEASVA